MEWVWEWRARPQAYAKCTPSSAWELGDLLFPSALAGWEVPRGGTPVRWLPPPDPRRDLRPADLSVNV